ncbi:MAG: tetratricopeptide repeat protein [Cyanobium sp.]
MTAPSSSTAPAIDDGDSTAVGDAESLFDQAIRRYQQGAAPEEVIDDFLQITAQQPRLSAGWTCLAWLQLLLDQPHAALRSARTAVRLNPQDPHARINLSVAMLETGQKGVREHVELVQRVMVMAPELAGELTDSMADGLRRRPGWQALEKVRGWLQG